MVLISLIPIKREIIVTLVMTLMRGSHTRESNNSVSTIQGLGHNRGHGAKANPQFGKAIVIQAILEQFPAI